MNSFPEIKSGINDRLKEVSPNLDLSQAPPINQKRLVTFVNHFLINIADFLNKFSKHCSHKLIAFDQKINKIEAELCLLESKLNSIPEVADSKDVNVVLPKPEELEKTSCEPEKPIDVSDEASNEVAVDNTGAHEKSEKEPEEKKSVEEKSPVEENPELVKYRKMVAVGVPVEAVKIKMQIEGLDPSLLES